MTERIDVAVIGAGPAGALAARQIARRGASVLLVDKAAFPRPKVCGCTVNGAALDTLDRAGLHGLTDRLGAPRLHRVLVASGRRRASLPLPRSVSLSREAMDLALVEAAAASGVDFRDRTNSRYAGMDGGRHRLATGKQHVRARVIVVADGLGGAFLKGHAGFAARVAQSPRFGAGVVLDRCPASFRRGVIYMACGEGGYVGAVRLEDERLDVAAAFDPNYVKQRGGPGLAASAIMRDARFDVPDGIAREHWRGTPSLTRRRDAAGEGIFVVGDAAGYVEPFTGEGIAWALAGGAAVTDYAVSAAETGWRPTLADQWRKHHRALVGRRQATCRAMSWLLRHPKLMRRAVGCVSIAPALTHPLIRGMNRAQPRVAGAWP